MKTLVLLCAFILMAQVAHADYYVNFTDGRVYVFPSSCIKSMNTTSSKVEFTANDNVVYSYPLSSISSIDDHLTKELPSFTSYKFNDKYNYQMVSDAEGIIGDHEINATVGGIGKWLTASFQLSDEMARAFVNGREQQSKVSRLHFDTDVIYIVGYPGDRILTAQESDKYALEQYGKPYTVTVVFLTDHSTRVPRIDINTVDSVNITSKKVYVDAEIIIDGAGVFPSMTDSVKIKGRGNTSWSSNPDAKNPYRLKFDHKVKPLGLTNGKNWVLLANKIISSMTSNAYGMKAASLMGTAAANHMIPVDLYINGTYKGSYNFTEKVGFANNSVDIDDESAAALLEMDNHYDEVDGQKFYSQPYLVPINIKKPEFADSGSTVLTFKQVKNRVNRLISAIYYSNDIIGHVDIDHAARYTMLNEYIYNYEILQPKSVFCYIENVLDDSCKFVFGPVWDFDWAYGYSTNRNFFRCDYTVDFYTALNNSHKKIFINMRYDENISARMLEIWEDFIYNGGLDELCDFCMEYYQYAQPSFANNKQAGLDNTNYENVAIRAAEWFRNRAMFIYETLRQEHLPAGDVNCDGEVNIADANAVIDILLSGNADVSITPRADINGDGEINIADVNALIDILLGC